MIDLIKYTNEIKSQTVERIALFFCFHSSLIDNKHKPCEANYRVAEETLNEWLKPPSELYSIVYGNETVGFLRLAYRGSNVAWIEDIYVDSKHRNKGIATQAIKLAEEIIKTNPDYNAICFDVVPRNTAALKLYNKLGYDNLSIVTVRKDLNGSKRDKKINIADIEFKY